jgi:quercetin dioxygenase-like cupin family protein
MSKKLLIIAGGILLFLLNSSNLQAQDWEKVNSEAVNMLADTTFLKAYEVTLKAGEKSSMHTHPNHFFYALTEGKLIVHFKDGSSDVPYNLKPGDFGVQGPEGAHITENVGTKTAKYLVVELKE